MPMAIFDFETIAKHARLKALDGKPQNVVQPMGVDLGKPSMVYDPITDSMVPAISAPVEFDGYGMYAGFAEPAPIHVAGSSVLTVIDGSIVFLDLDTAPSEYCPPEQDGA